MLSTVCDGVQGMARDSAALADSAISLLHALYAGGMPDGLGPGGLAAGAAVGAAAGAAAASGGADGTAGGVGVGRNDPTRPQVPSNVQARRDAQREYEATARGRLGQQVVRGSAVLQRWAESFVRSHIVDDTRGTTAAASKA